MTKMAALQAFFATICTAYPSTAVVDDVPAEYLTYTPVLGAWGDGNNAVTVNIYCRTGSEKRANELAQALSDAIGRGGVFLPCAGGALWIKRAGRSVKR